MPKHQQGAFMNILILGSGPNVTQSASWPRAPFDKIVAINNAWRVRRDWDFLVHPSDFPVDRQPVDIARQQRIITHHDYVPAQNALGGFVYAGGTMAFTAAYWALHALHPKTIAFLGCDMTYSGAQTHFYGQGTADPLRKDVTLRSLEAKSARFMAIAAQQGCNAVNLSTDESRLVFPRASRSNLVSKVSLDQTAIDQALRLEADAGYMVPSGKYWKEEDRLDTDVIDAIDAAWSRALVC